MRYNIHLYPLGSPTSPPLPPNNTKHPDARVLRGSDAAAPGPRTSAAAPYYYARGGSTAATTAPCADASDLPAQAKGGGRGEGTALPGFAKAGIAAPPTAKPAPVPVTAQTHNNGGAGLPEGTALPMFGSTTLSGPGPATPAAVVDTSLPRKTEPVLPPATPEGTALPAFGSTAVTVGAPPQAEIKTSSVRFKGSGAAAEGYVSAQAGAAP